MKKFRDQLKRILPSRKVRAGFWFLFFLILISLLAPVIANHKPLMIKAVDQIFYPSLSGNDEIIFSENGMQKKINFSFDDWKNYRHWMPLIPFSPLKSSSQLLSPPLEKSNFQELHLLGTTRNGSDLLSSLIHAIKISLWIAFMSVLIAAIIGLLVGSAAGYFGDDQLKTSCGILWMSIIGIIPAFFIAFYKQRFNLSNAFHEGFLSGLSQLVISIVLFSIVMMLFYFIGKFLSRVSFFNKPKKIKLDFYSQRFFEIFNSVPRLILFITLAAISKPSVWNVIFIIGFTSWVDIARITRAEFLKLRNTEMILSAKSLGLKNRSIIFRHALPNALTAVIVVLCFSFAGAILMESGLSFLGLGVPPDTATLGSLLSEARLNYQSWWLVLFPSLIIFLSLTSVYGIAESIQKNYRHGK